MIKNRKLTTSAVALLLSVSSAMGQQETIDLTLQDVNSLYSTRSLTYAGIHDPSIVHDNSNYYYIFGTHNGIARTSDLQNWTGVSNANLYGKVNNAGNVVVTSFDDAFNTNQTKTVTILKDGVPTQVQFGNFDAEAWHCALPNNEGNAWTVAGNMWAPDVIYNKVMQKWCMYLSLNGPAWNSVIILLTANNITGPYVYQGPVVYTGFRNTTDERINWKKTDLELVIGEQSALPARYNREDRWGTYWPHAIDPNVYYDEEGKLRFVYGSWSGGIYTFLLDEATGLRDYTVTYPIQTESGGDALSDPYFGKRIAGGYYSSGEGPYVKHIGNYYYLFVTYGGLEAKNGYAMRCFRSESPEGPFLDASGETATFHRYYLNYGKNDAAKRGQLVVSAFGDWAFHAKGEVSQGHNSAYVDDQGRAYVIYHTRFNDGTEGFQNRVHQLFTNQQGWLCTAPMEFAGETWNDDSVSTRRRFTDEQIQGTYQMLIHRFGLDNENYELCTPKEVTLTADGKVTGSYTGTWTATEGTSYIKVTISGTEYNGVAVEQTVDGSTLKAIGLTGTASNGQMLWAYKVLPQWAISYNIKTYKDAIYNLQTISTHVDLSCHPDMGVETEWFSSDPDVISNDGKYSPRDTLVNLSLTHRYVADNYRLDRVYNVKAAAAETHDGDYKTGIKAYYAFDATPLKNAYEQSQTGYSGKQTHGTAPTLLVDPLRVGKVVSITAGTQAEQSCSYYRFPNPLKDMTDLKGFTISLWVKRAVQDRWGTLWAFTSRVPTISANQQRLFLTANSHIGFTNQVDTFAINYPTGNKADIPLGRWALVTVTVDSTGVVFYVNHAKRSTRFASTAGTTMANFDFQKVLDMVSSASYLSLGMGNGIATAEACYDDLLVYDRALTADDVHLLHLMEQRVTDFTPEGTFTGIVDIADGDNNMSNPSSASSPRSSVFYDLQGRPVNAELGLRSHKKGLYIVNGKKVVVK